MLSEWGACRHTVQEEGRWEMEGKEWRGFMQFIDS